MAVDIRLNAMIGEHHAEQSHQAWRKANADNHIEAGGHTEQAIFDMGWDAAQSAFSAREADLVGALGKLAKYVDYLPHPHCVDAEQVIRQALKPREASHG